MKSLLALLFVAITFHAAQAAGRNWTLANAQGGEYSFSENSGSRPTLLIFWASWCKPCKREMTELKDTYDDLQKRGMNVILISEDNQKTKSRVKPLSDSKGYEWTALLDPDGEVLKLYGGTSIPFTVVLDEGGSPVYKSIGEMKDPSEMLSKANQLIESPGE